MVPYKPVNFSTVDDSVTRVGWHAQERLKEVSSWSKHNIEHPTVKHIDHFKVTEFEDPNNLLARKLRLVFTNQRNLKEMRDDVTKSFETGMIKPN